MVVLPRVKLEWTIIIAEYWIERWTQRMYFAHRYVSFRSIISVYGYNNQIRMHVSIYLCVAFDGKPKIRLKIWFLLFSSSMCEAIMLVYTICMYSYAYFIFLVDFTCGSDMKTVRCVFVVGTKYHLVRSLKTYITMM